MTNDSTPRMPWEDVVHYIAQAAINITEGNTVIEEGSKCHKAMDELCRYVGEKRVVFKG